MKKLELSQQATVVALAAVLPVITSTYKLRMMDATILALTGGLAVYNVNCLTKGNCNTWATLTAVSFFVMTLLQLKNYEGAEGETPDGTQEQDGGDQSTDETTTSGGNQAELKGELFGNVAAYPSVAAVQKLAKPDISLDPFASLNYMIKMVTTFLPDLENTFKAPGTILTDVILEGDLTAFTDVVTAFGKLLSDLTTLQTNLLNLAENLVGNLTDLLKNMCDNAGLDQVNSLLKSFLSIHVYMNFIQAALTNPENLLVGACSLIGADGNLTGDAPFNTLFNNATGCIENITNSTSVVDFFEKATTCIGKINPVVGAQMSVAGGATGAAADAVS